MRSVQKRAARTRNRRRGLAAALLSVLLIFAASSPAQMEAVEDPEAPASEATLTDPAATPEPDTAEEIPPAIPDDEPAGEELPPEPQQTEEQADLPELELEPDTEEPQLPGTTAPYTVAAPADFLRALQQSCSITLADDIHLELSEPLMIPAGQLLHIDLDSYTLDIRGRLDMASLFDVQGYLTVTDSAGKGRIMADGALNLITARGETALIIMDNAVIELGDACGRALQALDGAQILMGGGAISA